jgi:TPR repeat protein
MGLEGGIITSRDPVGAIKLYQRAARNADPSRLYNHARHLAFGLLIRKDVVEAAECYRIAALNAVEAMKPYQMAAGLCNPSGLFQFALGVQDSVAADSDLADAAATYLGLPRSDLPYVRSIHFGVFEALVNPHGWANSRQSHAVNLGSRLWDLQLH